MPAVETSEQGLQNCGIAKECFASRTPAARSPNSSVSFVLLCVVAMTCPETTKESLSLCHHGA